MSIKATTDDKGFVTGFYHPDQQAPEGAIEIGEEDYSFALEYPQQIAFSGGDWVRITPPPPTPEQILASLSAVSHAQIIAALILAGVITEAEGVAWITGTLPASVGAMIAALPAEQRTIARLRAIRPSSVVPTDPLVAALAASEGKSIEDLTAIFTAAAAL